MSTILLLHSALGLRPAVTEFGAALEDRGHTVVVPDYYEGEVFDDEDAGIEHRDRLGAKTLFKRILPVVEQLPDDAALGGFSLGAAFAQTLAATRGRSAGIILMHSVAAPFGRWPGAPVQVHRYEQDHWIEPEDVDLLRASVEAEGASFEDFVTPGKGHLFTDVHGPDGDAAATQLTVERIDALLSRS